MLAYNITFSMEHSIVLIWESWIKDKFLPMLSDSGLNNPKVFKVFTNALEERIFTLQFQIASFSVYNEVQKEWEPFIYKQIEKTFGNDVVSFTSLIQEIELH